jgi:hypothetical protein
MGKSTGPGLAKIGLPWHYVKDLFRRNGEKVQDLGWKIGLTQH